MSELQPKDYLGKPTNSRQGQSFLPWDKRGYTVVDVLSFLEGRPWDEVALAYVHGVRPSHIRVVIVDEGVQLDAQNWRVTVFLMADGVTINRIEQEVEVGLPEHVPHGAGLKAALQYGLYSPQVEWYNQLGMECYDFTGGGGPWHYKRAPDGTINPFPE